MRDNTKLTMKEQLELARTNLYLKNKLSPEDKSAAIAKVFKTAEPESKPEIKEEAKTEMPMPSEIVESLKAITPPEIKPAIAKTPEVVPARPSMPKPVPTDSVEAVNNKLLIKSSVGEVNIAIAEAEQREFINKALQYQKAIIFEKRANAYATFAMALLSGVSALAIGITLVRSITVKGAPSIIGE